MSNYPGTSCCGTVRDRELKQSIKTMKIFFTILLILTASALHAQLVSLKGGMKITSSIKVQPGNYALQAGADLNTPVIEISGDNIVVDFNNATLRGNNGNQMPDEFEGLAILIKGGKNITIKNLNARGYKVALMARDVESLLIENCNFSYNYRKHLNSSQEKEDISDWMSFHQNEKDEWLRYGAAIYMRNCGNFNIRNNIVTGGQCALMLTNCNEGLVQNNNFSFNSAIGIGMYRSSGNKIINNKLDFNVRGYSHGVYQRGQDSAAILVYEQCRFNWFANNSATHSGDGFFLWAGQSTMDTGAGGCNDNTIFKNDFSYAPTNGIEVTFSRNNIIENTMVECDHGIWGGYSYQSVIKNNRFAMNRIAIAIEHGQEDTIADNYFTANKESIRLWARNTQPADWGYAKNRDTRSRDYVISGNRFSGDSLVYNISNTSGVKLKSNLEENFKLQYRLDSFTRASLDTSQKLAGWEKGVESARDGLPEFKRGRQNIMITEWGPYDFRYPLLWLTNPNDSLGVMKFKLLGPKGGLWWYIKGKGIRGGNSGGTLPDSFECTRESYYRGEVMLELGYSGPAITTLFGEKIPAGKTYRFGYRDSRVPLLWDVRWYAWDSTTHPVSNPGNWQKLTSAAPVQQSSGKQLDYAWWGGLTVNGRKVEKFITSAECGINVEKGVYELSITWDDAVRVYLDGKLIINEWNPSLYKFDESPNKRIKIRLDGKHTFRVDHAELGGFATLAFKLKKL
jgi:parallel beta-helix repeat protein